MQACAESGNFCTVSKYFLEKFFLENQLKCSTINGMAVSLIQKQEGQGFLWFYRL